MAVPAILNAVRGAYRFGRPAARALGVDVLTDPQTYIRLGNQVDDVLRGALPGAFKGAGIQNAPTRLLGQVDDAARLPIGSNAREAAIGQTTRNFQMANRLQNSPVPRPGSMTSTGALRAPNFGGSGIRKPPTQSTVPRVDPGPQASYQAFREIGGPQAARQVRNAAGVGNKARIPAGFATGTGQGAGNTVVSSTLKNTGMGGGNPLLNFLAPGKTPLGRGLGALGRANIGLQGAQIVDNVRKGEFGYAGLNAALMFPGKSLGLLKAAPGLLSTAAAPVIAGTTGLLALTEGFATRPAADGTLKGKMSAAEEAAFNAETKQRQAAEIDRADAEETLRGGGRDYVPPVDEPSSTLPGNDGYVTPVEPEQPTSTQLPPTAEQTVMDPYAYQLAVYGQGRNMTGNQQQMDAVRDLGLAINRSIYGDQPKTVNPLMQRTFPDRYPQSLDAVVEEKGVMLPGSMLEADTTTALVAGTTANDPYKVEAQTRAVEKLLEQAQVDAMRRRFGMD